MAEPRKRKPPSSPRATGGAGNTFECHLQALFVVLMLSDGYAPCLPAWPIKEIKLQGRVAGYETDDMIVFIENRDNSSDHRRLFGQAKRSISFTNSDRELAEVMQAAWDDFNNSDLFALGKDVIVLFTGLLSATETKAIEWILSKARASTTASEFFREVIMPRSTPTKTEEKLNALRFHLEIANDNEKIGDDEFHSFLRHFFVIPSDIESKSGLIKALLHSLIGRYSWEKVEGIYGRTIIEVQEFNRNAGTITRETLPDDLVALFSEPIEIRRTQEYHRDGKQPILAESERVFIALANLLGAWDDGNDSDQAAVASLLGKDYAECKQILLGLVHHSSTIKLRGSTWKLANRLGLLSTLGSYLTDRDIDSFHRLAEKILLKEDYSYSLQLGVANGIAMIANNRELMVRGSTTKTDLLVSCIIESVLSNCDIWKGSQQELFRLLAEADQNCFMTIVERILHRTPHLIETAIKVKHGVFHGLLMAFYVVSWDATDFSRVCLLLGELAEKYPETDEFFRDLLSNCLPWCPQTLATVQQRKTTICSVVRDFPQVGWKLLVKLISGQSNVTSEHPKPVWRKTLPEGWEHQPVKKEDYYAIVDDCATLAVAQAKDDIRKQVALIDEMERLSPQAFDDLLNHISSITNVCTDDQIAIWERLIAFCTKHRGFTEAPWALPETFLVRIEKVAERFAPQNPCDQYRHLFIRGDNATWINHNAHEQKQREAIRHIYEQHGVTAVIAFANTVDLPVQVGMAVGYIEDKDIDAVLLPKFLSTESKNERDLTRGFVYGRTSDVEWATTVSVESWTSEQIGIYLSYIPFNKELIIRYLGEDQASYWSRIEHVSPNNKQEQDWILDQFQKYEKYSAAIIFLEGQVYSGEQPDAQRAAKILINCEAQDANSHSLYALIPYIQKASIVSEDDKQKIEWKYLSFFNRYDGKKAIYLERKLATSPQFFMEILQSAYYPQDMPQTKKTNIEEARKAFDLLELWRTPPGTLVDGSFDEQSFTNWIEQALALTEEAHYTPVAQVKIGHVLFFVPADPNGLWISTKVAEILNRPDADVMREGFQNEAYNSRGVHTVDKTGTQERGIAQRYREKAEALEAIGLTRFAITLRNLASEYIYEAERNVERFGNQDES